MKIALLTLALVGGLVGVRHHLSPCRWIHGACEAAPSGDPCAVSARFVEARAASVFAGACHYSSEYTTQGRRAVLGVVVDRGTVAGQDLAGVSFACALAAAGNLADGGERRAVLFVDEGLDPARTEAVRELCRTRLAGALGRVERLERVALEVALDGERYAITAGDEIALAGALDPDRACCSMPQNVWYRPLVASDDALVGQSERFTFAVDGLGPRFERRAENNAFVGRWRAPAPTS